ncbi:Transcriptional regulator, LysR family (plasmid) [Sodalis praecaptivus]|uniref:Transcriptional regulator, LysR family n=1 Tax=Sodalis praecaptivus TaxID=1239307 RepID=W0I3A1_9GAMM|nr:LysR family transcriptional regulator [Sodalis praecaptivus]AHF79237.1 Transcriptional regulator, LysR family [Sodalis praecaptivus]
MFFSSNLKCFIVLAREKSLKKASETLFVTSSPISRRIKIFEEQLGYKLFHRTEHNFTLTKKGRELYEKIIPYYAKISELEEIFSQKNNRLIIKKSIMIGVENINPFMFDLLINNRKNIESISYCSSDACNSFESLCSGEIQAVISHREMSESNIISTEFYSEPICYLMAKGIAYTQLGDMKSLPIIIPKNGFHDSYIKIAHRKIITLSSTIQVIIVDDVENYLFLIENGDAVGLMSESMASFYKKKHSLCGEVDYNIDPSFPKLKAYIYCLKEQEEILKNLRDEFTIQQNVGMAS